LGGRGQHQDEGGFWTSHDEESIARVVEMTGGVGCDGKTRDVHLDCVSTEAAKVDEVVLVYPRLEVTLWDAGASGR